MNIFARTKSNFKSIEIAVKAHKSREACVTEESPSSTSSSSPHKYWQACKENLTQTKQDTTDFRKASQDLIKELKKFALPKEPGAANEFVDIKSKEVAELVEKFCKEQSKEIQGRQLKKLCKTNSYDFINSIIAGMNANSLMKELKDHNPETNKEIDLQKIIAEKNKLFKSLAKKYKLSHSAVRHLNHILRSSDHLENLSIKNIAKTLKKVATDLNLGEHKSDVSKVIVARLVGTTLEVLPRKLMEIPRLLWIGTLFEPVTSYIDKRVSEISNPVEKDLYQKYNTKIANSLFFNQLEFMQDLEIGEAVQTLNEGKEASISILQSTARDFIPIMGFIGAAATTQYSVNPLLAAFSVLGFPITYYNAKNQSEILAGLNKEYLQHISKSTTSIQSKIGGATEILTSPEREKATEEFKSELKRETDASCEMTLRRKRIQYVAEQVSTGSRLASVGTATILYHLGEIKENGILVSQVMSNALYYPVKFFVESYFTEMPQLLHKIDKANKLLDDSNLSLPSSPEELERTSIHDLEDHKIEISGLVYETKEKNTILEDVSFTVEPGKFVTLVGESGCGKSTLIKQLTGLLSPSKGSISIGGKNLGEIKRFGKESIYSLMSLCSQSPYIFPDKNLRENLTCWSGEERSDDEIKDVLKELRLEKFVDKLDENIKHFSGGEKVRIGLARTLLKKSKILVLDEPTASLDPKTAEQVKNILQGIHKDHKDISIICVTHDQALAKISDESINLEELNKAYTKRTEDQA